MAGRLAVRRTIPAAEAGRPLAVARPLLPDAEALLPYLRQMDGARWYSNFGPLLSGFEARLAARFRSGGQVVTAVNATQGLALALRAMDLPPGSLCMAPAFTFVATAHAILEAGLVPYFVDVDPETWMIDPDGAAQALAGAPGPVRAVIPVAAFGAMPSVERWLAFQSATGVRVLVDAAAAFDAADDCRLPLVVSLHATKVMGIGEGGFLATTDEALASKVRALTTYGFSGSRESAHPATNAKLSEYGGAVGQAALDQWPRDRLRYLRAAQLMRIGLVGEPQVRFQAGWGIDWVTSVCVVALPEGAAGPVARSLARDGVETRRWWGEGCHRSPAFARCPQGRLATTDRLAGQVLGLPFAIDLDEDDVGRIAAALRGALNAFSASRL